MVAGGHRSLPCCIHSQWRDPVGVIDGTTAAALFQTTGFRSVGFAGPKALHQDIAQAVVAAEGVVWGLGQGDDVTHTGGGLQLVAQGLVAGHRAQDCLEMDDGCGDG